MIQRCARFALALLAGVSLLLTGCSGGDTTTAGTPTTGTTSTTTATATAAAPTGTSGLPTVEASELPPEARETLALIARGGPYPYTKDGTVFGNVERVLPRRERGYYREYTVKTPGERDRGARRIVTGRGGETYYTDDHYETFREVVGDAPR